MSSSLLMIDSIICLIFALNLKQIFMSKSFLLFLIPFVTLVTSCKDENPPEPVNTNPCVAGTGGSLDLAIVPQHHGSPIYGATTYIEFNTQSSPGALSNYDLMVEGEADESHIHVNNMKCGDYFIYCVGYDSTISMIVRGGIPYSISQSAHGDLDIHVPVTE